MEQIYLSDQQVAKRYGVKRGSVWRWVRQGLFPPPVKISPGCSRWSIQDLEDIERERTAASRERG